MYVQNGSNVNVGVVERTCIVGPKLNSFKSFHTHAVTMQWYSTCARYQT